MLQADAQLPAPRAAIAWASVAPLVLLGRFGLIDSVADLDRDIAGCIGTLAVRIEELSPPATPAEGPKAIAGGRPPANVVQSITRRIGRTLPLIYGAGPVGAGAAYRWKCQINENAKTPAFFNSSPELLYNEICGWGQHGDLTRQVFTAVHLRHGFESERSRRSFEFLDELQREVVGSVIEVVARGDSRLAQLFDLVLIGDLVSLALAAREGVDPGPVPIMEDLARRLR